MLRNPVYIGCMKSKKWGTVKGRHEAIVSEHVFRNVQLILKGKRPVIAPYQRNHPDFPLRRFLHCSECGKPLTGGGSTNKPKKKYPYYFCYNNRCRAVKSVRTVKAEQEFIELLGRLRVGESFLCELSGVLKEEWVKQTGDSNPVVRKLKTERAERLASQQKLLEKYLNDDPNILPHFAQMNQKFEEDIAALESQIAEADMEKATFEQLLEFSKSVLVDIPTAWERASLDQKQRVQNVLFPNGLKYHPEKGILNSENDCLFSQLEGFLGQKISMVRPTRFELVT